MQRHWSMMRDGTGWRRTVPSPAPQRIQGEVTLGPRQLICIKEAELDPL
jgi:carbamate kinase